MFLNEKKICYVFISGKMYRRDFNEVLGPHDVLSLCRTKKCRKLFFENFMKYLLRITFWNRQQPNTEESNIRGKFWLT